MPNPEPFRIVVPRVVHASMRHYPCERCGAEPRYDPADPFCQSCRKEIDTVYADLPGA